MATAGIGNPARWRALLALLWKTGQARVVGFGVLVVAVGLLPTALIVATGALVRAIPAAVRGGLGSPAGQPALLALAALVSGMALLTLCGSALAHLTRVLGTAFALEVHDTVAGVTLGTPGLAPLEDPAVADELAAIADAERRDVLRRTAAALSAVVTMRLRGIGAFVVLLGFQWWAPLAMLAAWHLTNLVYLRATENGVTVQMSHGATRLRRAEYLRSLALESAAAKEVRVFGLGPWVVGRYGDAWLDALRMMWKSRGGSPVLTAAATLALAVSHAAVLGALGVAAFRGDVNGAALLVFVQAVIATADLGIIDDWQWFLAQSLAVSERTAALAARVPAASSGSIGPAGTAGLIAAPRSIGSDASAESADTAGSTGAVVAAGAAGSDEIDRSIGSPGSNGSAGSTASTATGVRASGPVAVRLDDVRFTYRGREKPTLDGLTLDIVPGQSLAVVGENGAGKSTLIKLLCGLYEPDAGRVTLDGGLTPRQARRRIAVIFQDFVRYALPLRENVAFGHLPLLRDTAALESALRDAGGADLLARLPRGWDTVLSREFEGGADLSGGQWQRVALARALTAVRGGAGLLILDEPTAALDVRAETELFDRFLEVTRGVTTILVSHRLSSVRHADRIVVIEGGRVVEDGTHASLLGAGGRYATMYTLQAERFAEPSDAADKEAAHA